MGRGRVVAHLNQSIYTMLHPLLGICWFGLHAWQPEKSSRAQCPAVSCGVLWHSTSVFGVSELSNRSSSVSTNSKMSTEASSLLCDALDKSIDKSANPDNCDGVRMALRQRALEPSVGCSWCTAGRVQALGCNILGANASPVAMYDSKAYGLTRLLGMWWSPLVGEKWFTSESLLRANRPDHPPCPSWTFVEQP